MKQRKILEINDSGLHLICIKTDESVNPYRLYDVWYDLGTHKKLIAKYADLASVLAHIPQIAF